MNPVLESRTFWTTVLGLGAFVGGAAVGIPVPWELTAALVGITGAKEGVRHIANAKAAIEQERLRAWKGNPMRAPVLDDFDRSKRIYDLERELGALRATVEANAKESP